jgi:asparagine synthase (glutamine-hydrolysing)
MCGIAGMVQLRGAGPRDNNVVERMLESLRQRGPDDCGLFAAPRMAMGIRRLSIIDLANGHQPISNEDDTVHVVMNGELYSYVELRKELMREGHVFRTGSDTEVVVHGYESWGFEGLLRRLNGMFAIALHDVRTSTTFLARDRLGIKPLMYFEHGGNFLFASTIAALYASGHLAAEPDALATRLYLSRQFIPAPWTAIRGVRKLLPGTYLTVRAGRVIDPVSYWSLPHDLDHDRDPLEWQELLNDLIEDSVRVQMRADVPVGALLSGGLDSSIILGLMARHATGPVCAFNVRFPGERAFDESAFARMAAERFGARLYSIDVDAGALARDIDDAIVHLNEPVGDPAIVPSFSIAREARRHVKVVLTGEGADEIFSGYGYYRRVATTRGRAMRRLKACARGDHATGPSGYPCVMSARDIENLVPALGTAAELRDVTRELEKIWQSGGQHDAINDAASIDMGGWLPDDLLTKMDGMSMAHSLEARVPFLDHRVVETAMRIPGRLKRRGNNGKLILRQSFAGLLGNTLADREKHGFGVPLASWFRGSQRELLDRMTGQLDDVPWLDRNAVGRLLREHMAGRDHARALWVLYVLVRWHSAFGVSREEPAPAFFEKAL